MRTIDFARAKLRERRRLLGREWLVTNGCGGYASSTISGAIARRYHGLLIAALPGSFGRVVMLSHLIESLRLPGGRTVQIGGEEGNVRRSFQSCLRAIRVFRLEHRMPVWEYEAEGTRLRKSLVMVHGQNTVLVSFQLCSGPRQVLLMLQPSFQFRHHEKPVNEPLHLNYRVTLEGARCEVSVGDRFPTLRLLLEGEGACFRYSGGAQREAIYEGEADRGYASRGTLWSPGLYEIGLRRDRSVTLIASTESWEEMLALKPEEAEEYYQRRRARLVRIAHPEAREKPVASLVLAADQFIITPVSRPEEVARAHAEGDDLRAVIAGYHWFTDWGRDTMISLEGLLLTTGRHREAGCLLRAFTHHLRRGLIPNLFPEGKNRGLYHTADATLWYFHALDRYLELTGDRETLRLILPELLRVAGWHLRGTDFGIRVDAQDGLLRQGADGLPLTWMDAKVEDWVVTPRRGKAVEINALWYNALRLLEAWLGQEGHKDEARSMARHAARARQSFNRRFWNRREHCLYDVVDGEGGNDGALRPNQIVAFSLKHPVLDESRWESVLEVVRRKLVTPVGLRSLSEDHPDFKPRYFGDLRARDAAYHQGTVWPWLIGPFVDAWLKVHPEDKAGARKYLHGLIRRMNESCVGSLGEIYDATAPYHPRGCIAQAWSVAEVLRAWVKTA